MNSDMQSPIKPEPEQQDTVRLVVEGKPVLLKFPAKTEQPIPKMDTLKKLLLGGLAEV